MLPEKKPWARLRGISLWAMDDMTEYQDKYLSQFDSMEQLWLAFVMHELHSLKREDGEWK